MIEHNGGEGETGTPLCDKENGVPQTISNPNSLQSGPGGPLCSLKCQGGALTAAKGKQRLDRQAWHTEKQNQLQLQSQELWVFLTEGEYFGKKVAGILQKSFIAIAFLRKACFSEYTYTLANLMITLCI